MNLGSAILYTAIFVISTPAAIFEFDLGPQGMNGANERPTPLITSATGGELTPLFADEPGISYDSANHQLFLNFGWGSVLGYQDLVGTFLSARILGPADEDSEGSMIYNITPLANTITQNGASGGVFQKGLQLVENPNGTGYTFEQQEAQLFSRKWYINITSSFAPGGEIRGQLVAVPEPQSYVLLGSIALLGFGCYRRFKAS
jgi:hypothetical protein